MVRPQLPLTRRGRCRRRTGHIVRPGVASYVEDGGGEPIPDLQVLSVTGRDDLPDPVRHPIAREDVVRPRPVHLSVWAEVLSGSRLRPMHGVDRLDQDVADQLRACVRPVLDVGDGRAVLLGEDARAVEQRIELVDLRI